MAGEARKQLEARNSRLLLERESWEDALKRVQNRYIKNHKSRMVLKDLFHWTAMKDEDGNDTAAVARRPSSDPRTKHPTAHIGPFGIGPIQLLGRTAIKIPVLDRLPWRIGVARNASNVIRLIRAKDFQKLYDKKLVDFRDRRYYTIGARSRSDTVLECARELQYEQEALEFLFKDIQKTKIAEIDKQLGGSSGETSANT